ncbi:MAG TPA: hypothetical protein VN920_10240 [Pyrinomonadaceae bacterium]|nr:hypothetical protein [Pyrinomonadaceae bacterium]
MRSQGTVDQLVAAFFESGLASTLYLLFRQFHCGQGLATSLQADSRRTKRKRVYSQRIPSLAFIEVASWVHDLSLKGEKTMQESLRRVEISNGLENLSISLEFDGERESTQLLIDGVSYHFERIRKEQLMSEYKVDNDPDYYPQSDDLGYCYIIAPFGK